MKRYILTLVCALVCACAMADHCYIKVKADQADWTGEYLIVKEVDSISTAIVFDGSLTDQLNKKHNCFRTLISSDDRIAASSQTDAATFIIKKQADGTYTIRSKSGYYIGASHADSAHMTTKATTELYNRICFESDTTTKVKIQALSGYVLRFNMDPVSDRFRFYAEGKKKSIHLYKKTDTTDLEALPVRKDEMIDGSLYGLPQGYYILNGKLIYFCK